jgi:hypothetical protein
MRKFTRYLYRILRVILVVGLVGFLVPFIIFWRGEYVHILKSQWAQGEICQDKIITIKQIFLMRIGLLKLHLI